MLPPRIVASPPLAPDVERDVLDRIERLQHVFARITSCGVTIDIPRHRHLSDADRYRVRLDLGVPGGEVVINRQPATELRTALDEAFAAARRRLEDFARVQRGAVKHHEHLPIGRVTQYFPLAGYGFLESADGREIYFDQHSVLDNAFNRLDVGSLVHFHEEPGNNGPQATSVKLAARQHQQAGG
ncbi:MAG TPA: HPF/RaiA family ribosome-associated protein [Gemmatimonadales bacterium]|nr:HPF/RaiA family ribosome-associated protein [Gemmatimonadales bacterium]